MSRLSPVQIVRLAKFGAGMRGLYGKPPALSS